MKLTPLLLSAISLTSGMAVAQSLPDQTGDSKRPKYLAKFDERFKSADRDGDGALTKAEAEGAGMGKIVDHFERIDGNRDGKVTLDELRAIILHRISS